MSDNVIIEVKNAKKIYRMGQEKIRAVDGVSFTVNEGEFCCLLGTSGSGKSTLLNLMAGIEKLTSGEILIKGTSIGALNENKLAKFRQENLGFVFQSYNLIGSMTALENVEFPLVFKRVPSSKRKKMAKKMLKAVGLKGRMNHKPTEMSGGQQQRVGIARAFVAKPSIVFADEPTGNLDSHTTTEVMNLIKGMAKDNNQTVVMVTHDRSLTVYADKIINILDGHIESIEICENPYVPTDYLISDKKSEKPEEQEKTGGEEENADTGLVSAEETVKPEAEPEAGQEDKTVDSGRDEDEVKSRQTTQSEYDKSVTEMAQKSWEKANKKLK